MQTKQEFAHESIGIRSKDPREGFYGLANLGLVYTPGFGTSNLIGIEVGYDFIFDTNHSLRIFGFYDRTNQTFFINPELNPSKPDVLQIYRTGISAEYRIYLNTFVGFRIRLVSLGVFNFARTGLEAIPTRVSQNTNWLYPTIAFGPIFTYGKHELFVGYDLLDYEQKRGMSINYLKYSYRY